jgi:hypothetical protein
MKEATPSTASLTNWPVPSQTTSSAEGWASVLLTPTRLAACVCGGTALLFGVRAAAIFSGETGQILTILISLIVFYLAWLIWRGSS